VDAGTKLIGIFGHPVLHSLSPLFMNEALHSLGLNCAYLAFDVEGGRLDGAVRALKTLGWVGSNVTIPHKHAAAALVDSLSEDAAAIGAVNCIVNRGGSLEGHNTDHLGFVDPLRERGLALEGSTVALLGCGGAARGVLYALAKGRAAKVYLINRTEKHAREFVAWAGESLGYRTIDYAGGYGEAGGNASLDRALGEALLVVNTTPVGMHPREGISPIPRGTAFREGALAYDIIYNPYKTEFLRIAELGGATALNGLPMLINQGLHSLALWFPERGPEIFALSTKLLQLAAGALGEPGACPRETKWCIFLIGFMGSGKTTVGRILARRLGASFFDTDSLIEERAGMPVPELFNTRGEGTFREMERDLLREFSTRSRKRGARPALVIATGGGLPCSEENLSLMKETGTVVYLRASADDLVRRVGDGKSRPLIRKLAEGGDLREGIGKLLADRERFYLRADLVVANGLDARPLDAVSRILEKLEMPGGKG
jgi:shikimate dehydrogenase